MTTSAKTNRREKPLHEGPHIVVRSLWLENERAWRHDIVCWAICWEEAASFKDYIDMGLTGICYNVVKAGTIGSYSEPTMSPRNTQLGMQGYIHLSEDWLKLQSPREMVEGWKDDRERNMYLNAAAAITGGGE